MNETVYFLDHPSTTLSGWVVKNVLLVRKSIHEILFYIWLLSSGGYHEFHIFSGEIFRNVDGRQIYIKLQTLVRTVYPGKYHTYEEMVNDVLAEKKPKKKTHFPIEVGKIYESIKSELFEFTEEGLLFKIWMTDMKYRSSDLKECYILRWRIELDPVNRRYKTITVYEAYVVGRLPPVKYCTFAEFKKAYIRCDSTTPKICKLDLIMED